MKIFNAFFPEICLACCEIGENFCTRCFNSLYLSGVFKKKNIEGLKVYSLYPSRHFVFQKILYALKYEAKSGLETYFADLGYPFQQKIKFKNTYLVPVPISKEKLKVRGFNQCKYLANLLGMPILDVLERDDYKSQTGLSKLQRWQNVSGKIRAKPGLDLKDLQLVLFDDVVTTGATLKECEKAVTAANGKCLFAMTLASG